MTLRYYANAPATALTSGITSGATTMTVDSVVGFPLTFPYTLIIDRGQPTEEVVDVTGAAGNTLTIPSRGVDDTTAFAHDAGAQVVHGISARDIRESNAHVNAVDGVHGVTGEVVGDTDAQTLTNKDLTSGTNQFPTSLAAAADLSALSDDFDTHVADSSAHGTSGNVVGTSDSQTLTNKTLDLSDNNVVGTGFSRFVATDSDGTVDASSFNLPAGGDVVSTSDTQSLTNKTLTGSSNVMPVSIRCRLRATTSQSLSAGASNTIQFPTTDQNTGGFTVTTGSGSTSVTVPNHGMYAISTATGWDGVGAGQAISMNLNVNGVMVANDSKTLATAFDYNTSTSCSATIYLTAGDVVTVVLTPSNAGGSTTATSSPQSCPPRLDITWLGR